MQPRSAQTSGKLNLADRRNSRRPQGRQNARVEQQKSIIIVHHNSFVRHNIVDFFGKTANLVVTGQCTENVKALGMIQSNKPDFAIVEFNLQYIGDIEFIQKVRKSRIHTRVIVLTDDVNEKTVIRTLRAGANGYLLKSEPVDQLVTAIRFILEGKAYVSDAVRHRMLEAVQKRRAQSDAEANPEILCWACRTPFEAGDVPVVVEIGASEVTEKLPAGIHREARTVVMHDRCVPGEDPFWTRVSRQRVSGTDCKTTGAFRNPPWDRLAQ
jgi:DNA-binding NarL/FixJ family response regulator